MARDVLAGWWERRPSKSWGDDSAGGVLRAYEPGRRIVKTKRTDKDDPLKWGATTGR